MALFWLFLIVAAILFYRRYSARSRPGGAESPLDVAKKRYARGEINKEDFEKLKQDLLAP